MTLSACKFIQTHSNRIGTSADGLISLPVTGAGILADTCQDIILGTADQETLINASTGVLLKNISQGVTGVANLMQNLSFNLNANGTEALGNSMMVGLQIEDSEDVTIGGEISTAANAFASLFQDGIKLERSRRIKAARRCRSGRRIFCPLASAM